MCKLLILAEGPQGNLLLAKVDVALQAAAGEGKLPTFVMHAYSGGAMNVGWGDPVVVDLAGVELAAQKLPILRSHDMECVVGHTTAVKISPTGIDIEGVISGGGEDAAEVVAAAKNGFPWQASIGADPQRVEWLEANAVATVNGQQITGPARIVRACRLYEVSFVPIGADPSTSASVAAQKTKENAMTFEQWLKTKGFDKATLTAAQLTLLEAEFKANASDERITQLKAAFAAPAPVTPPAPAPAVQPDLTTIRAEHARVAGIQRIAAAHADIREKAIADGWTVDATELAVVRASRPAAPANTPAGLGASNVIQAALCVAGGLSTAEKQFDAQTLQAAHDRFKGRIGLQQLLLEAAWANGYTGRTFRGNEREILKAAFSSHDISGILSATANKFLLDGWMSVEDTWRQIAAIRSVTDFKTVTSYRLTGGMVYEKVGPDGELKHGKLGDQSYTNKADTYGILTSITRTDQVNDDLGALTSTPRMIGRGGALKFNSVFWTAFLNNAAFFTAGRGNFQDGAATALSIAALTAAELLFLNQTDPDGNPLGVAPEILLTPNALSTSATSLTRDLEIRDTTASTKYTTTNPHAGKFRPVRSSYLSNANISGYSAAAWYLLANPANVATIEAAFLNGQQNPTVETAEADFGVLGIQMRGYHDFGVALQEYRGGVKSKGTA